MTIFPHKFPLIVRALKARHDKLDILDTRKFTAHDRKLLQDLCNVFTPFKEATDYRQGQNIVTSSYVVPCVIGLKAALNNVHSRYNIGLVAVL